jgi:uncharacterized Zn finger protein (UPF0148 family)
MLDEDTFQQLLEAAYVMQQHNDAALAARAEPDPARTLSQIVETQELLRSREFDLRAATVLIAERLRQMTPALGVAIAAARDAHLEFLASVGSGVTALGSRVPIDSSFAAVFPPGGEAVAGSAPNPPSAGQASSAEGLRSLVVLPVHYEGKVAGILEVRFSGDPPYNEHVIQTCLLMKGLIAEAIARAADQEWKRTLATERATMIEALEKIKPQLDRLVMEPPTEPAAAPSAEQTSSTGSPVIEPEPKADSGAEFHPEAKPEADSHDTQAEQDEQDEKEASCSACGYQYGEGELFCGNCGTRRFLQDSSSALQGKWASMWRMQQAAEREQKESSEESSGSMSEEPQPLAPDSEQQTEAAIAEVANIEAANTRDINNALAPWTSATHTRQWLESLQAHRSGRVWLSKQRANIYLGAALLMLLIALSGWGTRRVQSGMANVRQKNSPAELTTFERLLVSLGVAEAPTPPVYKGNPNTQVWVDLHTALYYCPGSELYGKTAGGKFTSQRDAQQDQFEPAAQKSCD